MDLVHLFISSDHNFVGHHGQPPGDTPIREVDAVACVAGKGIRGDRYFAHEQDFRGQITFFAVETHRDLCARLGVQAPLSVYRRNVITEGVELNDLIGREFEIQGVRFLGTEECRPCYWMDRALAPGTESALRGNGGLRAKVLSDGKLTTNRQRRSVSPYIGDDSSLIY